MITASSIGKSSYMLYQIMQKTGTASSNPADWIAQLNPSEKSTAAFPLRSSNTVQSSQAGTALRQLLAQRLTEQQNDIASLESYSKKRTAFAAGFGKVTASLQKSAQALQQTDFSSAAASASSLADTAASIKEFAADYNNAAQFFSEQAENSQPLRNLAISFADAKYNKQAYSSIGIAVDSSGKLSVDQSKLMQSLQDDPAKVGQLLGENGLAARAAKKTAAAVKRSDKLYPSLTLQSSSNSLNSLRSLIGLTLDFSG